MYRFRFLAFSKSPLLIPFDAPFSPNLSEKSIENSKINFQLQENNSHVQTEKKLFQKIKLKSNIYDKVFCTWGILFFFEVLNSCSMYDLGHDIVSKKLKHKSI